MHYGTVMKRLEGLSHLVKLLQIIAAEALLQVEILAGRRESFALGLKHVRFDRLPEVVFFDDHVFIGI